MQPLSDPQLLAWLAGAVDPGRASEIAEEVQANRFLQARVTELERRLADRSAAFRLPPPSLHGFGMDRDLAIAMGDTSLRPGDRFRLRVEPPDDRPRWIVVLRRVGARWEVRFPTEPDELAPLDALPRDGDAHQVDLVVDTVGRQRWGIALPTTDLTIDWSERGDARWSALAEGIRSSVIPVSTVDLEVEEPS